jgi:general secretion pathway protein G
MFTSLSLTRRRRGFTLVEIILVVAIIMTLVGLVGPRLASKAKSAKKNATKIEIHNVKTALGNFEVNVGRFPSTAEGLAALVERPSEVAESQWEGPYMDTIPKDSWGNAFRYVQPSEKKNKDYDLISGGPDGKLDTAEDNITNDLPTDATGNAQQTAK